MRRQFVQVLLLICLLPTVLQAEVKIRVTPLDSQYNFALPPLCADGSAATLARRMADTVAGDLELTGLYAVLTPGEFFAPVGDCVSSDGGPFTNPDAANRAKYFVTGKVRLVGEGGEIVVADLYLSDLKNKKSILGKRYQIARGEEIEAAHEFANEILAELTGQAGIFGSRIAFTAEVNSKRELFTFRLGSKRRKQLTDAGKTVASPYWSPRRDKIVYVAGEAAKKDLYLVPAKGGKAKRITFMQGPEEHPRFSPDGKTLLTTAEISGRKSLVLFNLRGRLIEKLTESTADDAEGSWAPDGSRIVFTSNRTGEFKIYTMTAEGGRIRAMGSAKGKNCVAPEWSPNGELIAFICKVKSKSQLFISEAATGDTAQVTFEGENTEPSWSPDSRFLVFSHRASAGQARDLAVFSLVGGKMTLVTQSETDESHPAWAPGKARS